MAEVSGRIEDPVDLSSPLRIHVVGVGGPGMNPIAAVLAAAGHDVSGSDIGESPGLDRLRTSGVTVSIGHSVELVRDVDLVVRSTAIPDDNVEVLAAERAGIPVSRRAGVLGGISALKRTVAVAGTHGKTTVTSMLALGLLGAEMSPSLIVGGDFISAGSGSGWDGEGEWFVVEADESDGTFLHLDPEISIVTNIERDHIEYHGSFDNLVNSFRVFLDETTGPTIVCADDEWAARLGAEFGSVSYGQAEGSDYRVADLSYHKLSTTFAIEYADNKTRPIELPIAGLHNVLNASAAFAAGLTAGADAEALVASFEQYPGVRRRFELRGEARGVTFIDDYAHLATEVAAAIAAARSSGWDRVVAVFQPHRYSRTAAVWADFADSFTEADLTVLTDIYPAGERPRHGISGKLVVGAVLDAHPWSRVGYFPSLDETRHYLSSVLRPGDLCLTMGAGDLTVLVDDLVADQRLRS